MVENTFPQTENKIGISFTSYIKQKYSYYKLFLPSYKPANDSISEEELAQLEKLIACRDHFEIRQEISRRYFSEN